MDPFRSHPGNSTPGPMAANTSQRRAQSIILGSEVEKFRAWFLIVDCGQCGPGAVAMSKLPVDVTVWRVLLRMRCRVCGRGVDRASIDNAAQGSGRRVVKVWGLGPGSQG